MMDEASVWIADRAHRDARAWDGPVASVLDVGAHCGGFSRGVLEIGARRVIAVEPDSRNFAHLATLASEFPSNMFPMRCAVVGSILNPVLRNVGTNTGQLSVMGGVGAISCRPPGVRLVTLIKILVGDGRVDLLKMDVEGAEHDILDDVSVLDRVDALHMELHGIGGEFHGAEAGEAWAGCEERTADVILRAGFSGDYEALMRGEGVYLRR